MRPLLSWGVCEASLRRGASVQREEGYGRREVWVVCLVLVLVVVALLGRSLLSRSILLPADMLLLMEPWRTEARGAFPSFHRPQNPMLDPIQQQYPWHTFAALEIRSGTVPLWNPCMFSGTAFVANLQSSVYYPPNLLFAILPPAQAFEWVAFLHLVLAGLFTLAFLRCLGVSPLAAGAGAIGFASSGFMVVWLCFGTPSATLVWMPACLWLAERLAQRPSVLRGVHLGLPVAASLLAGHGQISLYVLLVLGAYLLFRARGVCREAGGRAAARYGAIALAGCALGGLLAMPQVLPTLEFSQINYRSGSIPYERLQPIRTAQLPALLIPDVFGRPTDGTDELGRQLGLGINHYIEGAGYAGCVLLALGAIGLLGAGRRERWFFLGAAAAAVLLAIGSPLNRVTYALIPGMKQMPNIARALCIYCLSVPVLGALGIGRLSQDIDAAAGRRFRQASWAVGALFGAIALRCYLPIALDSPGLHSQRTVLQALGGDAAVMAVMGRIACFVLLSVATVAAVLLRVMGRLSPRAFSALALGLVTVDMLVFGVGFEPACDPRILSQPLPTLDAAAGAYRALSIGPLGPGGEDTMRRLSPNVGMAYGIREVRGSESLYSKRYDRALDFLSLLPPRSGDMPSSLFARPKSRMLDVLNTRFLVTSMPPGPFPGWSPSARSRLLLENSNARGEAFIVPTARSVPDEASALALMDDPAFDPREIVPIEGDVSPSVGTPSPGSSVVGVTSRTNSTRARVSGPGGWLVWSSATFPGWQCTIDRQPTLLRIAYGVVQAVPVESGDHTVDFAFVPATSVVGWFLGCVGCAIVVGVVVFAWIAGPRVAPHPNPLPKLILPHKLQGRGGTGAWGG